MRPIKFRGKDHRTNQWLYGSLMIFKGGHSILDEDYDPNSHRPIYKETAGQYTGFKDRDGREIYEGDVLIDEDGRKAEVYWNLYCGRFDLHYYFIEDWAVKSFIEWLNYTNARLFTVVGNVHE